MPNGIKKDILDDARQTLFAAETVPREAAADRFFYLAVAGVQALIAIAERVTEQTTAIENLQNQIKG